MQLLKKIDFFAVEYKHIILKQGPQHKSILGGLFSFLVGLTCAVYIFYKFQLFTTGSLSPRVIQYYQESDVEQQEIEISILFKDINYLFDIEDNTIDPFNQTNLIIIPILKIVDYNSKQIINQTILDEINNKAWQKNLSISSSQTTNQPYIILIELQTCQNISQYQCASTNDQTNYFQNNYMMLEITINSYQFNPVQRSFSQVNQTYQSSIVYGFTQISKIFVQTSEIQVIREHEMLFQENYLKITNVKFYQLHIKDNQNSKLNVIQIMLDPQQIKERVEYIQLSEMISQICSIYFVVLLLKFIMRRINIKNVENNLIKDIVGLYYPKFKYVKISKNIFGKIISVKCNDQQLNISEFITFYQKVSSIAKKKMEILNILYEISRIQFIVQSIQSRKLINQSHRVGIPFVIAEDIDYSKIQACDDSVNMIDHKLENQLSDDDFTLLTFHNNNIPVTKDKFYEINSLYFELN